MKTLFIVVTFVLCFTASFSQTTYTLKATCTFASPCNWDAVGSWVGGVAPTGATPAVNSKIIIPENTQVNIRGGGNKVTITNRVDVQVFGRIDFSESSSELDLKNSGSTIQVATSGDITTSGAGKAETIRIGSSFIKGDNIDNLISPNQLTEGSIAGGGCAATLDCNSNPLPVELLRFNGTNSEGQVNLDWSTASQLNFSHFEVEHSINANDWSVLTTLQGEGTTNELVEYSYTHVLPHNGRNYYRLRMVDLDETFEYSEIVTANVSANNTVFLSPNPSRGGAVRYEMNFAPEEGDQLVVYDLVGGSVASQNVLSFTGELVLPSTLTRGTYLVRYKGQAVNQVLRLVVE